MRSLLLLLLLTIGKAAPVPRDELRRLEDKAAAHAHEVAKAAAHAHELDKAAHHAAQEAHIHEENANTHTHEVKQGRE